MKKLEKLVKGLTLSLGLSIGILGLNKDAKAYEVYEDFSGQTLDSNKWVETTDWEGWLLFDEHYLDTSEQRYHTAQLTSSDRTILLTMKRKFNSGESLDYDVYYNSGDGNILSRIFINDWPGDMSIGTPDCNDLLGNPGFATGGAIGYWNGVSCVGENKKGLYHTRVDFLDDRYNVSFTDPDGLVINYIPMNYSTPPFKVAVSSRTGHDGSGHIDYDNFIINSDTPVPVRQDTWGKIKAIYR